MGTLLLRKLTTTNHKGAAAHTLCILPFDLLGKKPQGMCRRRLILQAKLMIFIGSIATSFCIVACWICEGRFLKKVCS